MTEILRTDQIHQILRQMEKYEDLGVMYQHYTKMFGEKLGSSKEMVDLKND